MEYKKCHKNLLKMNEEYIQIERLVHYEPGDLLLVLALTLI